MGGRGMGKLKVQSALCNGRSVFFVLDTNSPQIFSVFFLLDTNLPQIFTTPHFLLRLTPKAFWDVTLSPI